MLLLFGAITAHKIPASMSMSIRFLRRGAGLLPLILLMLPYHLLPPLAILIAAGVQESGDTAPFVLSGLAAGTFLYVGAFEVICEEFSGGSHHDEAPLEAAKQVPGAGSHTHGHSAHSCDGDGVDATAQGYVTGTPAKHKEGWNPGRRTKFAAYCIGVALLLGITAALPEHEH